MKNHLSDSTTLLNLHVIRHSSSSSSATKSTEHQQQQQQLNSRTEIGRDGSQKNMIRLKHSFSNHNHSKNSNNIISHGTTNNRG